MSVDFTFAQVSPSQPLYELMVDIESKMKKIGFRKSNMIYDVKLDERGVFEETEKEIIIKNDFKSHKKEFLGLNGLSVEFVSSEFTVYFLVCNHDDHYLNFFIEVTAKVFDKITESNDIKRFFQMIGIVAESSNSYGGFGTFELAFEPIPREKVISYIFNNPDNVPSLLGIISIDEMVEDKIRELAEDEFKVFYSTLGFYYLANKDL